MFQRVINALRPEVRTEFLQFVEQFGLEPFRISIHELADSYECVSVLWDSPESWLQQQFEEGRLVGASTSEGFFIPPEDFVLSPWSLSEDDNIHKPEFIFIPGDYYQLSIKFPD